MNIVCMVIWCSLVSTGYVLEASPSWNFNDIKFILLNKGFKIENSFLEVKPEISHKKYEKFQKEQVQVASKRLCYRSIFPVPDDIPDKQLPQQYISKYYWNNCRAEFDENKCKYVVFESEPGQENKISDSTCLGKLGDIDSIEYYFFDKSLSHLFVKKKNNTELFILKKESESWQFYSLLSLDTQKY